MEKTFILSDEDDRTTDDVLDWLVYFNKEFTRVNGSNGFNFKSISLNNNECSVILSSGHYTFNSSEISSYWYRRGHFNLNINYIDFVNKDIEKLVNRNINAEYNEIVQFLHPLLETNKSINSFFDNSTNKLFNLYTANQSGLSIPDTIVTCSKKELIEFKKLHGKIITKPLGQAGFIYEDEKYSSDGLTAEVTNRMIDELEETFFPSLFQSYQEKAYELRIFYLNEKFYSSAIFSQLDEQTKTDFRNYNKIKPNRVCAYELPVNIADKLREFMIQINMNSGSFDIIVTPKNDFVFLEVNPVGQFAQVSYPCNYYLEKKVAEYLTN